MFSISYNIGCRNCLTTDGLRQSYLITNESPDEYLNKTEYEVMNILEAHQTDECKFCGSTNIEFTEIEIDRQPLYDFDKFAKKCQAEDKFIFMINLDKTGSEISLKKGGSKRIYIDFLKEAVQLIIDTVNSRPNIHFTSQLKGNFFICIREHDLIDFDLDTTQVERLRHAGITKNEILSAIKSLAEQVGITDINVSNKNETNILDGVFKGAMFNSWFYADSLEKAEENGYYFSNACFQLTENITIAWGTADDESPRQFIDNNKSNNFIVDKSRGPYNINGKTVYYAKRVGN